MFLSKKAEWQGSPEFQQIMGTTVEQASSWQEMEQEVRPQGSIIAYQKYIEIPLHEESPDPRWQATQYNEFGRLEFVALVYPIASRADQQAGDKEYAHIFRGAQGFMYDIEVFYNDDLIFHRERAFPAPQKARGFPGGADLAKAVQQLSQFIDQTIDNRTVGEFFELAQSTKGKGPGKLSKKTL